MKKALQTLTMVACLLPSIALSRNYSSIGSGNFTSSSTWQSSYTPAGDDTLTIESGHTVTVSSNLNYTSQNAMFIIVKGSFYFNGGGSKIRMATGSIVDVRVGGTVSGNGSGNSQTIVAGGSTLWSPSYGTVNGPQALGGSPLPVSLVLFDALVDQNGAVNIVWATASEHNSEWFVLERSDDGKFFAETRRIHAAGSSNELNIYTAEDRLSQNEMAYYRLVQYDLDGKSETFATKQVGKAANKTIVSLWPNPSNGVLNIDGLCIGSKLDIYDINGRLCFSQKVVGSSITANLDILAKGFYTVNVSDGMAVISSQKWVLAR